MIGSEMNDSNDDYELSPVWLAETISFLDEQYRLANLRDGVYAIAKRCLSGIEIDNLSNASLEVTFRGAFNVRWFLPDGSRLTVTFLKSDEFGYRKLVVDGGLIDDSGIVRVRSNCITKLRDLVSQFYGENRNYTGRILREVREGGMRI
jgi:hypothetical protein